MNAGQRTWLETVSPLSYANPFLPERIQLERSVLGSEFLEDETVWSYRLNNPNARANIGRIMARLDPLMELLRGRLREGIAAGEHDLQLYEDAVLHLLYQRSYRQFYETGFGTEAAAATPGRWKFYTQFLTDWGQWARAAPHLRVLPPDPASVRIHFSRHHRQLDARSATARLYLAIHFHARYPPLPADALRADGRVRDVDHGSLGDG